MIHGTRKSQSFSQPVRGGKLPPEANSWGWHPSRPGVPFGPPSFRARLAEVDPDLELTLNRYTGNYQVWVRKPKLQTKTCWGWTLLFPVHPAQLNELVLAHLFEISAKKWGTAKTHFDSVIREWERDKANRAKQHSQDTMDSAMEMFDHSQISVAMHGKSNGSKFSTYQS